MVEVGYTGYGIVQSALSLNLMEIISRVLPRINEFSRQRIGTHTRPECGVYYAEQNLETQLWALGLIFLEWGLENLHKKTEDGHCYRHPKPCPRSVEFHKEIYRHYIESFEEVLSIHRENLKKLGNGT